jgi:glyoxylase-like metal-dependent hydrolase (beta-lactamase superfamily II)
MIETKHPAGRPTPSRFLTAALAAAALFIWTPAPFAAEEAPPKPVTLSVEQLDSSMYRISGSAAGGVVVLVGKKGLLLVDSGDVAEAATLDSVLRTVSTLPVRYVINTHYHYDHVGGNERYRKSGATLIAHENMWAQASKDTVIADWGDWHRKPAPGGTKPQTTFADTLRLRVENETVVLTHIPRAHTDGDVMISFPDRNVLMAGDVVEIGAAPFVDLWAGGSIGGMINGVDRLIQTANDSTRIIPGHGSIISRQELREYRKMVATLANLAAESIAEGRDMMTFLAMEPAAAYQDRLGSARAARNMMALFYYGLNGMKE